MRILLIPQKRPIEFEEVKNFSGMWQYYLYRELSALGCDITMDRGAAPAWSAGEQIRYCEELARDRLHRVDHIIGLSRYFSRIDPSCVDILRRAIPGAVTQIHDGPVATANTDTVFSIRDDGEKWMQKCTYIGWAADPEKITPRQDPTTIRILIDHKLYHAGEDFTDFISASATEFADRLPKTNILIRRFCNGGAETVTKANWRAAPFTREHIPFTQIVEEYQRAHLFMVTHRESLGLSVLESAIAGALPVAPVGFVVPDRLATVRHMIYRNGADVPWEEALREINMVASREKAMQNSWRAVAERILQYLSEFKR